MDHLIVQRAQVVTAASQGPEAVMGQMVRLLRELPGSAQAGHLAVAATGRVRQGVVSALNLETMPGWIGIDLRTALAERTGLPVTVLNDADAAALGEARLGAGLGLAAMMFVTVSTGVGAGIVLGGQLLQSASGVHADFGYLRAENGHTTESLAGGRALEQWTRQHGGSGGAAQLIGWALDGNTAAAERLDLAVSALVRGFGEVRVMMGIENVVIGGSVGLNPEFFRRLRACAQEQPELYRVRLWPAQLGADAGLYGAALFAEQQE